MATSSAVGRPKIEGLKSLNVRLLDAQVAALDAGVVAEQSRRGDPGFNRTDALREAAAEWIVARSQNSKRAR